MADILRTANPALNAESFADLSRAPAAEQMTIAGTVHKTAVLLVLNVLAAAYVWQLFFAHRALGAVEGFMMLGIIGGFVCSLVIIFVKTTAPYLAPVYAVLEGLALGGISAAVEASYPGLVIQAVVLTFGDLAFLLFLYQSGLVRATENFKLGVVSATGAVAFLYVGTMILGFFGVRVPFIYGSGPIGIGFSLFVVVIASLNLVLDFDFIETGAREGSPKYMEWYGAFGLMVTLVWLYLEILRLLMKLQRRE